MRCALLFVLGAGAVAQAADISVPGGVLRAEKNSQVRMTGDQVELSGGTITFQVQDPDAARVEILTPSVSMKAYAEGVYRITVRKTGESEITAQSGRTLVVAPAGEQWLEEGQKMIARGPRANPQYRIVSAVGWWRRLASLLQNIQIGGGGGGSVESGGAGKSRLLRRKRPAPSRMKTPRLQPGMRMRTRIAARPATAIRRHRAAALIPPIAGRVPAVAGAVTAIRARVTPRPRRAAVSSHSDTATRGK